jgi:hypothetical protein
MMDMETTQTQAKEEEQMEQQTITIKLTLDQDGVVIRATDLEGNPLPYGLEDESSTMEGNQLMTLNLKKGLPCCWGDTDGRLDCRRSYCIGKLASEM